MTLFTLQPLTDDDREWVSRLVAEHWGGPLIVSRGKAHQADRLPGFAAWQDDEPAGLATFHVDGSQCELVTLDSLHEGLGIGTALIEAVRDAARRAGCRRLWLITTNDNLHALRFYQKRGFVLVAVHRNALAESRKIKPGISLVGFDGIPLRDEIELEMEIGESKLEVGS